jgi:hypothetical protein
MKYIFAAVVVAALCGAAYAKWPHGGGYPVGGTPPGCSNSFDLSKSCNSQYLGFM